MLDNRYFFNYIYTLYIGHISNGLFLNQQSMCLVWRLLININLNVDVNVVLSNVKSARDTILLYI